MSQLRVGGLACGHDGAMRGLQMPINAALRTADETILGACLLTITAGIGLDQPTDHRFRQAALRSFGWVEKAEIEKAIGQSRGRPQHESRQPKNMSASPCHESNLLNQSEDLDRDIGIDKQNQSQQIVGENVVLLRPDTQWQISAVLSAAPSKLTPIDPTIQVQHITRLAVNTHLNLPLVFGPCNVCHTETVGHPQGQDIAHAQAQSNI